MRVRANDRDTADALCWRHLGTTAGVTEQVLQANHGLCDFPDGLPAGYAVELPEPSVVAAPERQTVQLWD